MLSFQILTLFPRMVEAPLAESILGKAQQKSLIEVHVSDIRSFATDKHRIVDDTPYGGGAGMVMKPEPLVAAIEDAKARRPGAHVVLMSPRGRPFDQQAAKRLHQHGNLVLVCGRYEGVDERVSTFVDEELSVGDFVLTGGEFAALCVVDSVARLEPGVLGNVTSAESESFQDGMLEYPQYTRPPEFRGMKVPEVLLSGDHQKIARWRRAMSLKITRERRPDLLRKLPLSTEDMKLLGELEAVLGTPPREEVEGDDRAQQDH